MRRNNTTLIILIAGIFLFLLLAVGSLAFAVFRNDSDTTAAETVQTEKTADKDDSKDTAKTEKKTKETVQEKVTLADLKKKTPKNTEYSDV